MRFRPQPYQTCRAASLALSMLSISGCAAPEQAADPHPNFVLVMADDMGWGQTGYYRHPVLQTPQLDAMAAAGLRFDRFYAGAPNCSPTRATVMTGRTNDRTGVQDHGFALRRQERTIARALNEAGYATAHFGKWHLNGLRGPGVPVLADDTRHPGVFGFDTWLSVTNFFERDPLMSREGLFVQHRGDSSEVIVAEALGFIRRQVERSNPFFAVIWYGSPHSPWIASEEDRAPFAGLDENSRHHYGELAAMDRSIGTLRSGLRELQIERRTVLWFTSDNGGLPKVEPGTVAGLRGFKGSLYEGGIRVPAIIEWPEGIRQPRVTKFPSVTMDIFPTVAAIAGLPPEAALQPQDGIDLRPLFEGEPGRREQAIGFRHGGRIALIDNHLKIVRNSADKAAYQVFDLAADPGETADISSDRPGETARLREAVEAWNTSVQASADGADYPAGDFDREETKPRWWMTQDGYARYVDEWRDRPEYARYIERAFGP